MAVKVLTAATSVLLGRTGNQASFRLDTFFARISILIKVLGVYMLAN